MLTRYHGIQLLLTRWADHLLSKSDDSLTETDAQGDESVKEMITHLIELIGPYRLTTDFRNQSDQPLASQWTCVLTEDQAATIIQSHWRGYKERLRLKKINNSFATFQVG